MNKIIPFPVNIEEAKIRKLKELKNQMTDKIGTLITAAFGLVAALAWNDTIKMIIKSLLGKAETIWAMIIYAVVVTIMAVIATILVSKFMVKENETK